MTDFNPIMEQAYEAFLSYQFCSGRKKKAFLYAIADALNALGEPLLTTAAEETHLPVFRFEGELARTCYHFRAFGDLVEEGSWVEAVIDKKDEDRKPLPRPDMRKMLIPLGPILVFGASNFPLAYSTPGGDTASALAAGCPVVVKGHPAHPRTSALVARAIRKAIKDCGLHPHVFQLVEDSSFEAGKLLTQHPRTAGVGFTGSLSGGRAIFDYAQHREVPIPVFSEMGSTNPVILLPDALKIHAEEYAKAFAGAITQGVGQFCTRPGIQLALESPDFDRYIHMLAEALAKKKVFKMLHPGIHDNYTATLSKALATKGVETVFHADAPGDLEAAQTLAKVRGRDFISNPQLHHEIFGPFSLMVVCKNMDELKAIWKNLAGQLTTTIIGTEQELIAHASLIDIARNIAGRIVFNYIPTGVEVANATVHGGPYPAATDARFTSVGMDAIKRWVRPVCFQDCPDDLLPDELKESNPLGIMRKVDGVFTR